MRIVALTILFIAVYNSRAEESVIRERSQGVSQEKDMISKIKVGGIYEHYRGKRYKVLAVARHSEDLSVNVVYQGLYTDPEFGENPVWVRPLGMFLEDVVIDGKNVRRFKEVSA
jgi:hypothetical protein